MESIPTEFNLICWLAADRWLASCAADLALRWCRMSSQPATSTVTTPLARPTASRQALVQMASSAAAPALACCFSNPADVAKTRLNLDNELRPRGEPPKFQGSVHCLQTIWRAEGVAGIQRGLGFAMLREASKNTFRLGLYDPLVHKINGGPGKAPLSVLTVAGAISGSISALICNPVDLLKTRLQLDPSHPSGSGSEGGAIQLAKEIIRKEGVLGLWRGVLANMGRSFLSGASQLSVNAYMKQLASQYTKPNVFSDACCALVAGFATVAAMNPVDVVRTRLYSQRINADGQPMLYRSATDCAWQLASVEGPSAFYKGAVANFYRTGPHTVLTFVFLGWIRRTLAE
eukprot:6172442-Pleurochrysis_carterae.AAC.2